MTIIAVIIAAAMLSEEPAIALAQTEPTPWLEETFAEYPDTRALLRYPNKHWSGVTEDVNRGHISLDEEAPPVGGKSMRYDFPSRAGDPRICRDYTVGRNVAFPEPVEEVWVEVWIRFSASFRTDPIPECRGVSAAGYKVLFLRVRGAGRFNLMGGVFGTQTTWGYPGNENAYSGGPHPSTYMDGKWHRWRFHARVGVKGIAVAQVDDRMLKPFRGVPIKAQAVYGIALGRNRNQGPMREASVWWGRIRAFREDPGWGW